MELQAGPAQILSERLSQRGWRIDEADGLVHARKREWPAQVYVVIDFGDNGHDPALTLVLDMGSMPLGGERFREIFNNEREEALQGFGSFTLRQLLNSGDWAVEIRDTAFLRGANSGISRGARQVHIDRCPQERGMALAERFVAESNRFVESATAIANILQRIYQRTVLGSPATPFRLQGSGAGSSVAPAPEILDDVYPWRR